MYWELFPVVTAAVFTAVAAIYLIILAIEGPGSYYGITSEKKRNFVFWGLKILEGTVLLFVIESTINLMHLTTDGGFIHTSILLIAAILITLIVLAATATIFVVSVIFIRFVFKKIKRDLAKDVKKFGAFVKRIGVNFVQVNHDYAEVIAKQGIFKSIVELDMLKWQVIWMRQDKEAEERERKREAEERRERIHQLEKEANEFSKPTIKPLWYPLEDKEES